MKTDTSPAQWDLKILLENWHAHLRSMIYSKKTDLPLERLLFQSQTDARYSDILAKWSKIEGAEREDAWNTLLSLSDAGKDEMLPICVRCGACCTSGSPTLATEDMERLGDDGIGWAELVTIRRGEPAHSRISGETFYLSEEKIKIREKTGTRECVFYDGDNKACTIHDHKPAQCRAQACWDPTLAEQQTMEPPLTRREIFAGMGVLLDIIKKHEEQCDFEQFRNAFELLRQTRGENIDDILAMLAFDDHVREFVVSEMGFPELGLDLVFGRSLVDRLRLFGFHVVRGEDGTKMLLPVQSDEP